MKPTLNEGDIAVVDTSVKTIEAEGIYVFESHGQRLVKRAQRKINGGLLLIDDNSCYSHTSLSKEEAEWAGPKKHRTTSMT